MRCFFLLTQDLLCILRSYSNILHYRSCLISIKEKLQEKKKFLNFKRNGPQFSNSLQIYLCVVGEVLQPSVISAICPPEGAALPLSLLAFSNCPYPAGLAAHWIGSICCSDWKLNLFFLQDSFLVRTMGRYNSQWDCINVKVIEKGIGNTAR